MLSVERVGAILLAVAVTSCTTTMHPAPTASSASMVVPTSAPFQTDSVGATGQAAAQSVFRIVCPEKNSFGTGFLHKSGMIITAGHVIDGCAKPIIYQGNSAFPATVVALDRNSDIALVKPDRPIQGAALALSSAQSLHIGSQVALWGFPAGYSGLPPMLSGGILSGVDLVPISPTASRNQWVLNAAINHGNSGGPVVLVETGEVIGVADNKIVPLSPIALGALSALQNQNSGVIFSGTSADGKPFSISEGQIVALVLSELREQVQLVVGHAAMASDVRELLKAHGFEP